MSTVKKAAVGVLRVGMSIAYALMKLFVPQSDTVVFLSRQSDQPSEDFLLLAEEIRRQSPSTAVKFSCKLGLKSEMGLSYIPILLRQMRMLAGARACVTESYCPPVCLLNHRPTLRVVQIWHSMVAVKRFGWQTVDTPEGSSSELARLMRMHAGYDYVVTGSEYQRQFFAQAMRQPIETIVPIGLPRADRIMRGDRAAARERLLKRHPQIGGRTICAYLPTMRRGESVDCAGLIAAFDYDRYALVIRLHPLDNDTVIDDERAIVDGETPLFDLLCAADIVISDYSGAAAEASLLGIPVMFYTPDEARYRSRCGLNIVPAEVFEQITFSSPQTMTAALAGQYDSSQIARVRELLAGGCKGDSTQRIADLVLHGGTREN